MCGICGYIGGRRPAPPAAMLDALAHRGPDDRGVFQAASGAGHVWFGHRRLSIIDLSPTGHQPMTSSSGDLTVVFNGEIYNHDAVRHDLARAGRPVSAHSDTAVLLAAWEAWGERALDRLRGMFAFAVWDARTATCWLARDRMGEKPLYYHVDDGRLVFASELRSLLASGEVPRHLDPDGLESYLLFGSVSQPYTLVRGVRMLEAGQVLRFEGGRAATRTYWQPAADAPSEVVRDRGAALALVREALDDAIRHCMVADVPIAVLLSGGVDSAALLARITALGYDDLATFNVGFEGADVRYTESPWARKAADRFGTRHHELIVGRAEARGLLWEALAAVDAPSVDGFNHYLVLQAIARAGYKVALTGQGADELFYGYSRHTTFAVSRWAGHLRAPRAMRRVVSRALTATLPNAQRVRKSVSLLASGSPTTLAYVSRHTVFTGEEAERLLGRPLGTPLRFVPAPVGDTPIAHLYDLERRHFLRNQLLRDGDQMSMARSLELRAPFVDHRLVEAVTRLPTAMKVVPGRQKPLLVDAVGDPLVAEAARRPKTGFPIPLARWIADEFDTQELAPDALGLDAHAAREVCARGRRGVAAQQYWSLLVLAAWMRANAVTAAP